MRGAEATKFGKYVVSVSLISVLYWVLLFLFTDIGHIWYVFSMVLTAAVLAVTGFTINYFWTWRNQKVSSVPRVTLRFIKYIIIGVSTTLLGWTQVYLLTEFAHLWYMLSSVISTVIVIVIAFLANNYWTWGKNDDRELEFLSRVVRKLWKQR